MTRFLAHLRANVVAYLALFVALGGTSYAAVSLPANSVGTRQIRNRSIDPDKFNPRFIRGNVRMWARVNAQGRVIGGGRGVRVVPQGDLPGVYLISPRGSATAIPRRCAVITSVDGTTAIPGYANGELIVGSPKQSPRWQAEVNTYANAGTAMSLPFDVAMIC